MLRHSLAAALLAVALATPAPPARAEGPLIVCDLLNGAARIRLQGSWVGARYAVERSDGPLAAGVQLCDLNTLCVAECSVVDESALVGATYWYRFDVISADGTQRTFGPQPVTIGGRQASGLSAAPSPNPLRDRGTVRITAGLAAGQRAGNTAVATGLPGEVTLVDTSGRVLRSLWRGKLDRLTFDVPFTARDARGNRLPAGLYFIVLQAGEHRTISRVAVVR
jgi:hypothetical protein